MIFQSDESINFYSNLEINFYIYSLLAEVDVERLKLSPALEFIDLKNNPLTARLHELLGAFNRIQIEISIRQVEDWEDLNVWDFLLQKYKQILDFFKKWTCLYELLIAQELCKAIENAIRKMRILYSKVKAEPARKFQFIKDGFLNCIVNFIRM